MASLKRPWPVLFLCCVLVFNTMGMAFGLGAIFTDIMGTFGVSRATASLVQSVCIGVNFGSGIFTGHFLQRQGPRVTVITGSVLATAGCVIAFLASHIVQVIVGIGVVAGLGSSFIYLTTQIVPGIMFHDMKSVALPIVSVATASGTAAFPPLYRHLIHHYALRGTFLILAAVNCQMILCGALIGLFTPRTPGKTAVTTRPREGDEAADEVVAAGDEERGDLPWHSGERVEDGRCSVQGRRDGENAGLLRGVVRDRNEPAVDDAVSDRLVVPRDNSEQGNGLAKINHDDRLNDAGHAQFDHASRAEADLELPLEERNHLTLKAEGCKLNPETNSFLRGRHSVEKDHPFQKGSSSPKNCCCYRYCLCCSLAKVPCLQMDLLRDTQFVVFAVLGPSSYLFFTQPMMFMTDMVKSNHLTVEDGSLFLSVMFAGSITGRVLAGVLYRLVQSRVPIVFSVAIATGGVTCLFYAFSDEFAHFVVVSFVFGVIYGLLSSSIPMTFLEILGPRRFAVGMGFMSTVGSISFLLAGPYGGTIRDLTNSYEPVFYIAVAHGLLVGLLLMFTTLRCRYRS